MLNADFGYQMQMTVDLTVEMRLTEKTSIRDNGLEVPLMMCIGISNHFFPDARGYRRPEKRSITRSVAKFPRSR